MTENPEKVEAANFVCLGYAQDGAKLALQLQEINGDNLQIGPVRRWTAKGRFKDLTVGGVYNCQRVIRLAGDGMRIGELTYLRMWEIGDDIAGWQAATAAARRARHAHIEEKAENNKELVGRLQPLRRAYIRMSPAQRVGFEIRLVRYMQTGSWGS